MLKTTIFCPSCGTANRDDAEMCSECGSVIPKLVDNSKSTTSNSDSSINFGIMKNSKEPAPNDFGIDIAPPPPPPPPESIQTSAYPTSYTPYESPYPTSGQRMVCERCGTVLRHDDNQCPGCGKPQQSPTRPTPIQPIEKPSPYAPSSPYPPPPYSPGSRTPPPPLEQQPDSTALLKTEEIPKQTIAKCARCGAIVYDYEIRCSNCGRILAPPSRTPKETPTDQGKVPVGAARCGRCNAIVYPHQTVCPNCGKPLAPVTTTRGPSQRISRCKRCGHTVYPTDTRCLNCGRKLDPI